MILDSVFGELQRILTDRKNLQHIALFVAIMVLLAFVFWQTAESTDTVEGGSPGGYYIEEEFTESDVLIGEFTNEQDFRDITIDDMPAGVAVLEFELRWQDEDDASATHTNRPDSFYFEVTMPWTDADENAVVIESDERANNQNNHRGVIPYSDFDISKDFNITKESNPTKSPTDGQYLVRVHCTDAGDQEDALPFPAGNDIDDNGNTWDFRYRYKLWQEGEEPEPEV